MCIRDRRQKGQVRADPYRQNLLNLFLARNDPLINNFEEHLLLMNRGNIDWRPLINLWSVLEYLSKYTAKVGKATQHIGKYSVRWQPPSVSSRRKMACTTSGDGRS